MAELEIVNTALSGSALVGVFYIAFFRLHMLEDWRKGLNATDRLARLETKMSLLWKSVEHNATLEGERRGWMGHSEPHMTPAFQEAMAAVGGPDPEIQAWIDEHRKNGHLPEDPADFASAVVLTFGWDRLIDRATKFGIPIAQYFTYLRYPTREDG